MSRAATASQHGEYQYLRNGQDSGISENWRLQVAGDQVHLQSTRRVGADGPVLSVASIQQKGEFQTCHMSWHSNADAPPQAEARYTFANGEVSVCRSVGGHDSEVREPFANCVFSPLMRIYTGPTIRQLEIAGGGGQVLVPWIKNPGDLEALFSPLFSQRQVRPAGTDTLAIDGREQRCNIWEYWGGEYQRGTRFWLGANDLLLQYCWDQDAATSWQVRLRNLA